MIKRRILLVGLVVLLLFAAMWLTRQLPLLLWGMAPSDAVDLRFRYTEWAAFRYGEPVYDLYPSAVYPAASYVLLSPLLMWQSFAAVRWLWAIVGIIGLTVLAWLGVRGSRAQGWLEKAIIFTLPFALHATGVTFGAGQLLLFVIPLAIGGVLLTQAEERWKQVVGALLFLFALIKPTVTAPFFLLILLVPRTLLPASLVVVGYGVLTFAGSQWQDDNVIVLMLDWLFRAGQGAEHGAESGGYGNQQSWLDAWHRAHYVISVLFLLALAVWVRWRRNWDIWVLLGVTALVARLYVYHRAYDDLLLLIPAITLWRLNRPILFLLFVLPLLLPVRLPFEWVERLGITYRTLSWVAILCYLMMNTDSRLNWERLRYSFAERVQQQKSFLKDRS